MICLQKYPGRNEESYHFHEQKERSNLRAIVRVFRTLLAGTHMHVLAFEWSVYRERFIFYCSKRHMALMAVKGLISVRNNAL